MSYAAVPTTYDHVDIPQPVPAFPPHEHTQYLPEIKGFLVHERSDSESQKRSSRKSRGVGTTKNIAIQVVAFLWIVPIVALLYLNIKGLVIGASAWCPFGHCRPHQYGGPEDTLMLLAEFDHNSHNLVGGLQFAAKALEVWFVLVSSALVFRVTMIMVHMKDGLPIGYLYRPMEYAEITSLIDREVYSTFHRMPSHPGRHTKKRVAAFLVLTIVLCIICNLMGPAVAVLLIPQLQWIDTDKVGNQTFQGMNSASPPGLEGFAFWDASDCSEAQFTSQQFSCADQAAVDGWVQSYQSSQSSESSIFAVQDFLTISYNKSFAGFDDGNLDTIYFVPSRQVVQNLTNDWTIVQAIDDDQVGADVDGTYSEYTRTVQSYLYRQGPLLGATVNLYADFDYKNHWWTTVDDENDQYLRCYASYNISDVPLCWNEPSCATVKTGNYTRCMQVGSGWDSASKYANFTITPQLNQDVNSFNGTWSPALQVDIYSSGKVAFLPNGTLPMGFSEACLPVNGTISTGTSCNWDDFFATGDELEVSRHSKQVTTWEISSEWQLSNDSASTTTLAIDFSVFQTLAEYSFDPSVFTNPFRAVDTTFVLDEHETFPNNITVLSVDPAWSLAAFAVDNNGVMTNNRPSANLLSEYVRILSENYEDSNPFDSVADFIEAPTLMPVIQLMSWIDFNTTVVDPKTVKDDPAHPLLSRWAHINVWAYSTDSRTSKFGIVVVVVGCVVVLAKVLLSLAVPKEFPGPLQILIAAMEHRYTGEFRGLEEEKYAAVPFKLHPDGELAGGYRFGKSF